MGYYSLLYLNLDRTDKYLIARKVCSSLHAVLASCVSKDSDNGCQSLSKATKEVTGRGEENLHY